MTDLPFKLNGVSFSDCVHKYGYETDRFPVYAAQWTDLSGVDHDVKLRDRGTLILQINGLPEQRTTELRQALLKTPLRVAYYSFQLGEEVEENMRIESAPASLQLKTKGIRYFSEQTLIFIQK